MDRVIEFLEAEERALLETIERVRQALAAARPAPQPAPVRTLRVVPNRKRHQISPAGKAAIAAAAKKRWAKWRREKKASGK